MDKESCKNATTCSEPLFVGVDPSINATGLVILDEKANIVEQRLFSVKADLFEESLLKYEKEIEFIPNIVKLKAVHIEGPSYQSQGQSILQMGAIHFLLRLFLFKKNINYKVIAPGTLKKFVAGKGNAKKDLMLLKTYKKWGVEFDDHNLSDSYGLARMAMEEYNDEQAG